MLLVFFFSFGDEKGWQICNVHKVKVFFNGNQSFPHSMHFKLALCMFLCISLSQLFEVAVSEAAAALADLLWGYMPRDLAACMRDWKNGTCIVESIFSLILTED